MAQTDVLNMSLDDIIKQKNTGSSGKERKKVPLAADAGMVIEAPPRNQAALDGNAPWEHDMYQEGPVVPARRMRPAVSGFKLLISNLDFKVIDEDIQELFEHCGPIKKAGIIYDRSGRSEEAAEVIFERREDALSALKKYNNLSLDGKPMKIELIEAAAGAPGAGRMLSSGIRIGGVGVGGQRRTAAVRTAGTSRGGRIRPDSRPLQSRGRTRGGGGGQRQARGRGAVVSQDDLDKDLDSYMATD